ncbi:MAG: hybrid sensor histidine kinase/response regulator [Burkholderiales bacterium]
MIPLITICYSLASVGYLVLLRARPHGGVAAQYLFLILDPPITVLMIVYEPKVFGWLPVLLLVIVARCGFRFGMRVFALEWACATASVAVALSTTGFLNVHGATATFIAACLGLGVPLFIPLIRMQHRSRELDLRQVKLETMAQNVAAKSEFLSRVSHELRSPLQAILSTLDLFELRYDKPDELALVRRVRRAANGLSTQLGDLLTLARSEAGNLPLRPQRVDVATVFAGLVDLAKDAADNKGLLLKLEVPPGGVDVLIDEVRLSQVVENLLTNAIKYTDVGEVTLRLLPFESANAMVRFEVQDTGAGISTQDLPLIFAPYERARARAYSRESAGVGLAVVQTLLAHMGGRVTVASVLGGGSTFTVEVAAAGAVQAAATTQQRRVLIVDDREDVLAGLGELVEEMGFETDRALTAGAASNLLAARTYDTVLFDLQMPVKSGAELARDTRRGDGPNHAARFISMTAGEGTDEGRAWPFDQFVRKPISVRTLKRLLDARTPTPAPT